MNFTDSPFERMMKQIPRPGRGNAKPCRGSAAPLCKPQKRKPDAYRDIVFTEVSTSGQIGPKSK